MTCSDVERVLPELLDGDPDGEFQNPFGSAELATHVQSCSFCTELVSDLRMIASESRRMAASEEPPARVWVRIAAQLRAEGLITEGLITEGLITEGSAHQADAGTSRALAARRRWSAWWLVPVAAAVLAAGSYVVTHKPAAQVARQETPGRPAAVAVTPGGDSASFGVLRSKQVATSPTSTAKLAPSVAPSPHTVEPGPDAEDQQFLSEVSTRAPSMKASYQSQLAAVNREIRETQAYLDQNPGDAEARQQLMEAYEQKTLLYQIALDRIQ
jgi:hypothetical protein